MKKLYPTFVLPAPHGCNLGCPYCVIAQRKEATDSVLREEHYLRFLKDILIHCQVNKMSIQGFEALLPETWPLTYAMLVMAGRFGCETSVITNGTYLGTYADELGGFPGIVDTLTISLDAADAVTHDKLRRFPGAFDSAVEGIKKLSQNFHGTLKVNSVLFPHRGHYLENMPELLRELGITEWALSPLIKIDDCSSSVPGSNALRMELEKLIAKAERFGIVVFLADEFRRLKDNDLYEGFYVRTLAEDEEIFRLSPDGSCSRGVETLRSASSVPKWDGVETPTIFLERIFSEIGVSVPKRSSFIRQLAEWNAMRV